MTIKEVDPQMELVKGDERSGWGLAYSRHSGYWYIVSGDLVHCYSIDRAFMEDIFRRLVSRAGR